VRRVAPHKALSICSMTPIAAVSQPESSGCVTRRRELSRSVGARAIVMLKNDREDIALARHAAPICLYFGRSPTPHEMGAVGEPRGRPEDRVSVVARLRQSLTGPKLCTRLSCVCRRGRNGNRRGCRSLQ